ncbi:MAG: tetratricopeptide repeat protein [Candidatus Binatia bacterium]
MKDTRYVILAFEKMRLPLLCHCPACKGRLVFLSLFVCFIFSSATIYAEDRLAVGLQLLSSGQLAEARRFFEAYSQEYPEGPSGLFYLGQIAFEEQRYEDAMRNFERVVQLDERNSDYHLWLGRACGRLAERVGVFRQFLLARKVRFHFERAVELNPENLAARIDLREYYEKAPVFLGGGVEKAEAQEKEIKKRQQQVQR